MAEPRARYPKSEATRGAILAAAIAAFGAHGFAGATTRRIAEAAGVALPAIAYHFGGKGGLHAACAETIVALYGAATADLAQRAAAVLEAPQVDAEQCRVLLAETLKMLLRLFVDAEAGTARADFATRALRERGAAFDILQETLWRPGVEATARLVAGIRGSRGVTPADRVDALMLISSLLAFGIGPDASFDIVDGAPGDRESVPALLEAAIDRRVASLWRFEAATPSLVVPAAA